MIEVPDTLKSNLSMAVTDATADGNFPDDDNIISRLLLTGDMRGMYTIPIIIFPLCPTAWTISWTW